MNALEEDQGEETMMPGPIVVGIDGSESSRLAVLKAGELAQGLRTRVVIVLLRGSLFIPDGGVFGVQSLEPVWDAADELKAIAYALGTAILDPIGISWSLLVRSGRQSSELMSVAYQHNAKMIVVAGRRRTTLGRFTNSRLTNELLRHWPSSIIVVGSQASVTTRLSSGA
jgi:nucleotide-binding universal stress UspA family protein